MVLFVIPGDNETETDRQTETETERDREREKLKRERERERERQRQRQRQRDRCKHNSPPTPTTQKKIDYQESDGIRLAEEVNCAFQLDTSDRCSPKFKQTPPAGTRMRQIVGGLPFDTCTKAQLFRFIRRINNHSADLLYWISK